jgi:hypothetical protein
VDCFKHRELFGEPEVWIVPTMTAYDLILRLPWFKTRGSEIDLEAGNLAAGSMLPAGRYWQSGRDRAGHSDVVGHGIWRLIRIL